MAFNGSGVFVRLYNWVNDAAANIKIRADRMDNEMDGFATGLTTAITKDGQTTITADLPMATHKHTGVGDGTSRTHYASVGQTQDGKVNWVAAGGTADAITASYAIPITALVDGQICYVRAGAANATTTPTFAPSGLTARTIVKNGGQALVAGDIYGVGHELVLRYYLASTRWELLNPSVTPAAIPVKASGAEVDTGTDDAKFVTAKAIKDSNNVPSVAPSTSGNVMTSNGTKWVSSAAPSSTPTLGYHTTSAGITIDGTDQAKIVELTGSTARTFAITAAATLGANWWCYVVNNSTAELTLDGNGSELDGLANYISYPGEMRLLQCTGSAINSTVLKPFDTGLRTATFNFILPPGYLIIEGWVWGAGASGGKGATNGGGGGGGGGCTPFVIAVSKIGAAGTSTTCTVGAGGVAQASANTAGNAGNNSTFGALFTGYGGGRGGGSSGGAGGGGGGTASVGGNATTTTAGTGGTGWGADTAAATNVTGINGGGGGGNSSANIYILQSVYGAGGGGAGMGAFDNNARGMSSVFGAGGGGGAGATTNIGGISSFGGAGGAGNTGAGNATAGTAPGGGGGGSITGTSGAGGDGGFRIIGKV